MGGGGGGGVRRFIFECNFDTRDFNLTSHVPRFYKHILTVWQGLHSKTPFTNMEYQHETIWNNRFIRIDWKPMFYWSWYRKGVTKIYHLLNENEKFYQDMIFNESMVCQWTF